MPRPITLFVPLAFAFMTVAAGPALAGDKNANPVERPNHGPAAPIVAFGGFAQSGAPTTCGAWIDRAARQAGLNIVLTGPPDRIAENAQVAVGLACLPLPDPQMSRIVVVAASSDANVANFYRNLLRDWVKQIADRSPETVAGAAPAGGTAPGFSMCAISGHGPAADMGAAREAGSALGLVAGAPTPGNEIALTGAGKSVVVASSEWTRAPGPLGAAIQQSYAMGFAAAFDPQTAKTACDDVRIRMEATATVRLH